MRTAREANRERFIRAAVSELEEHGAADFSIRRVSRRCGVSCAAPYKHFADRDALILEVIRFINHKWEGIRDDTVKAYEKESLEEQILAVCVSYITFLCTYPEYQTILLMNDRMFPIETQSEKGKLSGAIEELIRGYCHTVNMAKEERERKKFLICSLLCGAAAMINAGAVPFDSRTIEQIRSEIRRELAPDRYGTSVLLSPEGNA